MTLAVGGGIKSLREPQSLQSHSVWAGVKITAEVGQTAWHKEQRTFGTVRSPRLLLLVLYLALLLILEFGEKSAEGYSVLECRPDNGDSIVENDVLIRYLEICDFCMGEGDLT